MARNEFLKKDVLTEEVRQRIIALDNLAQERGQTLAQMALAWLLKDEAVTSVVVGASSVSQLRDNLEALRQTDFTDEELDRIDCILG